MNRNRILMIAIVAVTSFTACGIVEAQFNVEDIIVSEFFDDILRVNNGSTTDLFDIAQTDNITSLAIADSTTAYVVNFSEIWTIDTASNSVTTLTTISGTSPAEITMDLNGDLLVVNSSNGVERVNTMTGQVSLVYDDTFFGADDIAVSAEGHIYTTEFFDGLGRINAGGGWTKLGNWDTDFFNHVAIGPDGFLYLTTTFEGGDVYRVNPNSGYGTKVFDDVYTFIDDLQVSATGLIYLAGNTDTDNDGLVEDMVMTLDWRTGEIEIVVDENMVGNPQPPFFNPMDIEIFNGMFYAAPMQIAPDSVALIRGVLVQGGLTELATSDNSDLTIRRRPSDILSRTEFEIESTSPAGSPLAFEFILESSVFARSTVIQTVYLYNYQAAQFEAVDTQTAERFTDRTVTAIPLGNLSRFVENGTNRIRARVRFQSVNPRQNFSSSIDQVSWTISY